MNLRNLSKKSDHFVSLVELLSLGTAMIFILNQFLKLWPFIVSVINLTIHIRPAHHNQVGSEAILAQVVVEAVVAPGNFSTTVIF